ncbi:hypothetical protein PG630_01110 [Riemerella anatipestifer]|uniref:hypothetical protein n=1 Tax=Riemerella anatipestifer TaxID=34085 RepID=UPI002A879C64|nr:hypothetical protein [Riemerella anatipestifer]
MEKTEKEKKYEVYLNAVCFVAGYVTKNLRRLYLDVDLIGKSAQIIAFYDTLPTDIDLELLDDIETNSISRSPDIIFNQSKWFLFKQIRKDEYKYHDFLLFSFYEEPDGGVYES